MILLYRFLRFVVILAGVLFVLIGLFGYHPDLPVAELEAKYFTPESSYVQVRDSKVHIRMRGNGAPIILIHGSFSALQTWEAWEQELSKKYKTISLDLPGHGLTGPNPSHTYSTDDYTELVIALADQLKLDTFYVAGNSMGGQVTLKLALRHPERVKKIILIDAAAFGRPISDANKSRPFVFTLLQSDMVASVMTTITPKFLVEYNMKQVYGNKERIQKKNTDRIFDLLLREGNRKATMERLRQPGRDISDSIQFIHSPALIQWGARDAWIPLAQGQRLASLMPGSTLLIYDDAGHVPMEEIPAQTVADAINFLQR
ncbi:MAG TPA: alpha/beta hydrolase [Cyclobacteriaceae bacterium]|nr:alpha/beta hydrolase [Cyclobacteriaceae bacterium]